MLLSRPTTTTSPHHHHDLIEKARPEKTGHFFFFFFSFEAKTKRGGAFVSVCMVVRQMYFFLLLSLLLCSDDAKSLSIFAAAAAAPKHFVVGFATSSLSILSFSPPFLRHCSQPVSLHSLQLSSSLVSSMRRPQNTRDDGQNGKESDKQSVSQSVGRSVGQISFLRHRLPPAASRKVGDGQEKVPLFVSPQRRPTSTSRLSESTFLPRQTSARRVLPPEEKVQTARF